jgi:hypothetical protein
MAGCERLMASLQSTRMVRMRAIQSEGKVILIYSYFEIRVYFHPYYDMTLGYKSLGLSSHGAILIIVPTLFFEKDFIYSVYLCICLCCNHKPLAFVTRIGHSIL